MSINSKVLHITSFEYLFNFAPDYTSIKDFFTKKLTKSVNIVK